MKIEIEYKESGPLAHKPTLLALCLAVENSKTLKDASQVVRGFRLGMYRGGSHIAIHAMDDLGNLVPGRLAIISEYGRDAVLTRDMISVAKSEGR